MMKKKTNDKRGFSEAIKTWSFLDKSKQILNEDNSLKSPEEKESIESKGKAIENSDNIVETEPDINQLFKPKTI